MKNIDTYIIEKFKITKDIKNEENEENLLKKGDSFIIVFVKNDNVGHTWGVVRNRDYVSLDELEENFKNNTKNSIGGGTHYKAFKYSDSEEAKKYEEKLRKKYK